MNHKLGTIKLIITP